GCFIEFDQLDQAAVDQPAQCLESARLVAQEPCRFGQYRPAGEQRRANRLERGGTFLMRFFAASDNRHQGAGVGHDAATHVRSLPYISGWCPGLWARSEE